MFSCDDIPELVAIYRSSNYPFPLTESIQCLYCKQILVSPYQTYCGCRYCINCLDEYQGKGNTKCLGPDCEEIVGIMPDNAVKREIANIKVSCLFKSEGCHYEDSLKNMKKHLENCVFRTVACSECQEFVTKQLMDIHLLEICPMRNVKCEFCQKSMPLEKLKTTHLNPDEDELCEKILGICPYNCDIRDVVLLSDHLLTCKNRPMACVYSEFGCKQHFSNENMNNHFIDEHGNHATSLINHFKKGIDALNEKHNTLSKETESLRQDLDNLKNKVDRLQQDSSRTCDKVVFCKGTYIWRIDNFSRLKQSALNGNQLSITSDPFYIREFGYKMSMKIYPGGDWLGKGTHLSLFFTLMKGDYDDLLLWPFKNKVVLTILDQKNELNGYSETFKPDMESPCYRQPTGEYNPVKGNPKFIRLDQLKETYLKNDIIFVKIQILPLLEKSG